MSLTISARDLGEFAVPWACPRCLWIKLHVPRLPYQSFPSIFSTIDAYNKRVVHAYFDREGRMPHWLTPVGDIIGYVPPPSHQRFSIHDPASGMTLRGTADGIFRLREGGHAIVDYKTSRYTPNQGATRLFYDIQLNAYAYIGDQVGFAPVRKLALVYMEPVTGEATAAEPSTIDRDGFTMGFSATVVPVDLQPDAIPPLLHRVRDFLGMAEPPASRPGCLDCEAVSGLFETLLPGQ